MKRILVKNKKSITLVSLVILDIILIIILSGISVYATAQYLSSQIIYKDGKTVEYALNDLYKKSNGNYTYTKETNPVPSSENDDRIIYSSNDAGSPGNQYSVFDRNDSTFWTSDTNESLPQYIGWDFQEDVIVYEFSIKHRKDVLDGIVGDFVLQGYKNGIWEDIQSYTNDNFSKNGVCLCGVSHPKKYSKYQIKVLTATNYYSGSASRNHVQINQLDFYYLK